MVDRSELGAANMLFSRYQQYQVALALKDPRIVSFTLEGEGQESAEPEAGIETMQLTVSSEGIATPPQMLTAIRDQIEARIKEINDQLTGMGVSESPSRQAPQTPVATSGGAESRPTTQKPVSEPPKPASTPAKPSTSHSRGRR